MNRITYDMIDDTVSIQYVILRKSAQWSKCLMYGATYSPIRKNDTSVAARQTFLFLNRPILVRSKQRTRKYYSDSESSFVHSDRKKWYKGFFFVILFTNWMRVETSPFELWRNCGKTAFFIKRRNLAECTIEKVFSKELRYIIYYSISGPKKSRYLFKFMSSCKVWH